jgi:hypothetical protein
LRVRRPVGQFLQSLSHLVIGQDIKVIKHYLVFL